MNVDQLALQSTASARKRIVRLNASLAPHLVTPRSIRSLNEIHPSFWVGDLIPLLVPADTPMLSRLLQSGASQSPSGAPVIRKGSQIDFQVLDSVLPFAVRQTITPRCGDAIPASSCGSNLCHLLIPSYWETLRQQTLAKTGDHCEICGWWNGLDCHELWEYHEPIAGLPESVCGVQRLLRLLPLCSRCHETYHLGFANVKGRQEKACARLEAYNRYTPYETREYLHLNEEAWKRRSQNHWALDLSCVAPGPLVIQNKCRRGDDNVITIKTRTGESHTILLGVAWQCGKESYPAIPIEAGYFE